MTSTPDDAGADSRTATGVAAIAAARAQGWRVIVEILGEPDDALVSRVRNGDLMRELRESTDWLGDESARFIDSLAILDVLARRSRRRSHEEDRDDLLDEFRRLFPDGPPSFREHVREMVDLVEAEARAWGAGDIETGKTTRVAQNTLLEAELLDIVPAWCVALDERAKAGLYKLTPRLVTSFVSIESGRDFDRALSFGTDLLAFED